MKKKITKKAKKVVKAKPKVKITPAMAKDMKAMAKKGISQREIAAKYGCSRSGVWYVLQQK